MSLKHNCLLYQFIICVLHVTRPCCPQVNVVGDFDDAMLEELCLKYLGTIPSKDVQTPEVSCIY